MSVMHYKKYIGSYWPRKVF